MIRADKNTALNAISDAGVVGLGGAGFPTHVKYAVEADAIIANGCECEPLLRTDITAISLYADKLFEGLAIAKKIVGAKRAILAIKNKHANLLSQIQSLSESAGVELFLLDDFYPAGDEQVLIYECLARSVPPVSLPSSVNTVVSNTNTIMAVADAMQGIPLVEKFVTVTGAVGQPAVFRVPVGMPVVELINAAGGERVSDFVVVLGGPMMGTILTNRESLASAVVTKALGGVIVLPRGHYLEKASRLPVENMRKRAATACIQCRLCSELCPRYLIGHPFETHRIMRAFALRAEFSSGIAQQAFMCCECGICEHVACPMGLSPCSINKYIRQELRSRKESYAGEVTINEENRLWHVYRKVPVARLAERINIGEYMALDPQYGGALSPEEVFIPVRQHIGAPAVASVKVGDIVRRYDRIADMPAGTLGANIHASIGGRVENVGETIHIKRVAT